MRHQTFPVEDTAAPHSGLLFCGSLRGGHPLRGLVQFSLGATAMTSSQVVTSGKFRPSNANSRGAAAQQQAFAKLPAFCRVMLTSKPASDSDIRIEVWLPEAGWNGRFQAVGEGGLAGSIPVALMAPALAEGYATSGTDTGHVGGNADFMPGHPEKLIDFAYRSTHEMAVAGKAIIAAFYGTAPTRSYYNACSGGGRHALTSAQRYPNDFKASSQAPPPGIRRVWTRAASGSTSPSIERPKAGFPRANTR